MKIPLPHLPPLGRYIYHKCVSLYAEHTIIGTHLCPRHGDFCTRINRPWIDLYITDASVSMLSKQLLKNTYAPGMEIPIPELPLLGRHIDITDASVSILSMQLLEHTYAPGMEIPIPELPLLGRHIYIYIYIYVTDASVFILSMQLLGHTYVLGMEILIPELPPLGRHIYHSCASLYAEHTIIGTHLCPS